MFAVALGFEGRNNMENLTREKLAAFQQGYCIRIDAHHWKRSGGHSERHWDSWGGGTWATCNTMAVPLSRHVRALRYSWFKSAATCKCQGIPGHIASLELRVRFRLSV